MIAVIMQPAYLPWLGYFDLMDKADVFIFLDDVQFEKQSWQQRNRIKSSDGQWKWLSVPAIRNFPQRIDTTRINNSQNWRKKHWKTIEQYYRQGRFWKNYHASLSEIYSQEWKYLADLNLKIVSYLMEQFGIQSEILKASKLDVSGSKVTLLVNICHYVGADIYLSPSGSACYIEKDNQFEKEGIILKYQQFEHPVYTQLHGKFVPYMSAIDLLFNEGSKSLEIIRSGS